jgi:enamine deaminase RidA (YjgF/YER057c/UK114 family)
MSRTPLHNARLPAPVGYSRAVRSAGTAAIHTSMTAPIDSDGQVVGPGDAHRQAVQVIRNIQDILEQNGSGLDDVVQVTAFVVRHDDVAAVQAGLGECFSPSPPAVSLALVTGLPNPAFLVEIAAVAFTDG